MGAPAVVVAAFLGVGFAAPELAAASPATPVTAPRPEAVASAPADAPGRPAAPPRRIPAPEGAQSPPAAVSALGEPRAVVDWPRRLIRCSGVAPPTLAEESENVAVTRLRTERAARDAAVAACLAALRSVTVVDGVRAGDLLDGDRGLSRDLESAIRRAPVVDAPRLFSDGGVAVRLAVPIDGRVSELLLAAADGARAGRRSGPPR